MYTRSFVVSITALSIILIWLLATENGSVPLTPHTPQPPQESIKENVLPPSETEEIVACTMDAKICPDGSAVGRTAPNCEFAPCPPITQDMYIQIPQEGASVSSPVMIAGTARGNWFFEGSFPISIVNWDGLIIGEGVAQAQGEWMTEDFVPFTATISYTFASGTPYNRGAIILKKDNPSGLPEHDTSMEVPVVFE
jgi:hypothetical protein